MGDYARLMKISEWFYLSPEFYRLKARDEMTIEETHDALQHIDEPEYRSIHHWKPTIEAQLRAKIDARDAAKASEAAKKADASLRIAKVALAVAVLSAILSVLLRLL